MKKLTLLFLLAIVFIEVDGRELRVIPEDGELRGTVKDKETGEIMRYASVAIMNGESIVNATTTDDNGNYKINPIQPGTYTIRASFVAYKPTTIYEVVISINKITFLDIELSSDNTLPPIEITYAPSMVNVGETSDMSVIGSGDIENMPLQKLEDIVALVPGVVQTEEGGSLNIRGSRNNSTVYIVDGVRMQEGFSIPKRAIAQIAVITGGIPAQFGDVTGGVIVITTKSFVGR